MHAHVRRLAPAAEMTPTLPVAGLHRLGFHPALKFCRVNRPDFSEDGTYVLSSAEGTSPRGEAASGTGRWRILFTVSPRSFMVLFFGRLWEPRAEGAVTGACDRSGAARRHEELNSFWQHAALRRPRRPQASCLRWRSLGLGGIVSAVPNLLPPT